MSYNYETFAGLKTSLSQVLSDVDMVFWTNTELEILLNASLREWNALARMFRDRGSFNTVTGQTFYDLRDVLANGDSELFLAPTVSDASLLQQGKYLLMEPEPNDAVTFSDGVTADDFNVGFTRRRNQFLLETGLIISEASQVVNAGRVVIADDSIIDIRRASWQDIDGNLKTLFREDEFASSSFTPLWTQQSGTPRRYSLYPDPLLTLQLLPPPADIGTLLLQTISAGAVLDDYTPAILWGVLADICSAPGPTNDPLRSQYAEQRFKEYVIAGQQVTTAMQCYINGRPASLNSVFDFDTFKPTWTTQGVPKTVGMLGSNLVAVAPVANGEYSVIIDAVRNAPKLVNDADPVPIGREYLDVILNYASHLATFKQGGAEFQATFGDYDNFVKTALAYNNRMNAQNIYFETLVDRALREEKQVPLREEAVA